MLAYNRILRWGMMMGLCCAIVGSFIYSSSVSIRYFKDVAKTMEYAVNPEVYRKKSRAVVHMGIHKTGTTSIQTQLKKKRTLLESDGYLMPWALRKDYANRNNTFGHPCAKSEYILTAPAENEAILCKNWVPVCCQSYG